MYFAYCKYNYLFDGRIHSRILFEEKVPGKEGYLNWVSQSANHSTG